jgi:hypothetical protein
MATDVNRKEMRTKPAKSLVERFMWGVLKEMEPTSWRIHTETAAPSIAGKPAVQK